MIQLRTVLIHLTSKINSSIVIKGKMNHWSECLVPAFKKNRAIV